jgi:hypothetical protein
MSGVSISSKTYVPLLHWFIRIKLNSITQSYAKPLKAFARRKETAIISIFEANSIFGNVERLHTLNAQFLADWEKATTMKRLDWGKVIMEHVCRASGAKSRRWPPS